MQNIETMIDQINDLDRKIFDLEKTIADKKSGLVKKKNEMKALLDAEIAKQASVQLKDKDYGCGTATIETALHKIKLVVSKKVKWDEKQLFSIREKIVEAGKNPNDFIKEKLSVSETAYKEFDDEIKEVFEPARSVEPSAPVIKIERK